MSDITYTLENSAVTVRLGRKVTGHIRKFEGGYCYFPKGSSKVRGEKFATVAEVKRSIEGN